MVVAMVIFVCVGITAYQGYVSWLILSEEAYSKGQKGAQRMIQIPAPSMIDLTRRCVLTLRASEL